MRQKMEAEAAAELDRQKTAAGDQIAPWNSITKKSIPGMWTPSSVL